MSEWDRVERLIGTDNLAALQNKTVGVVGLGSGGGYVALTLAMSGVGSFVLVDPDEVTAQNVVRHVADLRVVGQPKVTAVADLIYQRNVAARVQTYQGRIEDYPEALLGLDIVVVGVDGEQTKYLLNEFCLGQHLTAIYAGVYERGEGGDVVVITPYEGPCYACWAANLREGFTPPDPNVPVQNLDYGQVGPDGTLKAEPALWLDVVRVANTQASIALNVLLAGTSAERQLPANTVILANQWLEIIDGGRTPPFGVEWVNIPRNPNCLVCGTLSTTTALKNSLSLDELLGGIDATVMSQQEEHDDQ